MFEEHLGEFGRFVERANDYVLFDAHDLAIRQRGCDCEAFGPAGEAPFAEKIILAEDGNDRLLAVSGNDRDLDLARSNVKNRIRNSPCEKTL